ncbi:type II toxin-antitoxin system RelE family toxin [Gloeothece verrucosa]|uniref:Plasmid stabilization system n=1 Tax=Gloeothece verrucosa (strain PCC 7822) TaxID=497965 RepID=E0UBE8_GLOV7|nr:type II toxin-antitoxin system RelE/ParE family toxin [Gloeothece verrucosa]ADN12780.1 plasmid stabilization system [Gloeothece verrucosa PCC 7822]
MTYEVQFKPKAIKDLQSLPPDIQSLVLKKIEAMRDNLQGNIKRLTNFTPEYRLRVGDYRVLFEIEEQTLIIYRIKHRKNAYQ